MTELAESMNWLEIAGAIGSIVAGIFAFGVVVFRFYRLGGFIVIVLIARGFIHRHVWLRQSPYFAGRSRGGTKYSHVALRDPTYQVSIPFKQVYDYVQPTDFKTLHITFTHDGQLSVSADLVSPFPPLRWGSSKTRSLISEIVVDTSHIQSHAASPVKEGEFRFIAHEDTQAIKLGEPVGHLIGRADQTEYVAANAENTRLCRSFLQYCRQIDAKSVRMVYRLMDVPLEEASSQINEGDVAQVPPHTLRQSQGEINITVMFDQPMPEFNGVYKLPRLQRTLLGSYQAVRHSLRPKWPKRPL